MNFFTKKHRTLLWRAGLCAFIVFFAVLWACAFVFLLFCCYGRLPGYFARVLCGSRMLTMPQTAIRYG